MAVAILDTVQVWRCAAEPSCGQEHRSDRWLPNRFHVCPRLRGMMAPMVLRGTSAKVEIREREDYVRDEVVTRDPERGRPVMSIVTTRDGGQDAVIFAPAARGSAAALGLSPAETKARLMQRLRRLTHRLGGPR